MSEQHEITPPLPPNHEASELSPVDKAEQKIVEYLKDAPLGSTKFQAFTDFVDWKEVTTRPDVEQLDLHRRAMIEETMRQRQNGMKGYKEAIRAVNTMSAELLVTTVASKLAREGLNLVDESGHFRVANAKYGFDRDHVSRLMEIKGKEIDKKSQ